MQQLWSLQPAGKSITFLTQSHALYWNEILVRVLVIHDGITNASKRIALQFNAQQLELRRLVLSFMMNVKCKTTSCKWNSVHVRTDCIPWILQNMLNGRDLEWKSYCWIGLQLQRGFKDNTYSRIVSITPNLQKYYQLRNFLVSITILTQQPKIVCILSEIVDIWCTVYALCIWHKYLVSPLSQSKHVVFISCRCPLGDVARSIIEERDLDFVVRVPQGPPTKGRQLFTGIIVVQSQEHQGDLGVLNEHQANTQVSEESQTDNTGVSDDHSTTQTTTAYLKSTKVEQCSDCLWPYKFWHLLYCRSVHKPNDIENISTHKIQIPWLHVVR